MVYNLINLGIETPLNLEGDLRVLREEEGLPVVFLFDEEHLSTHCLNNNLYNANELITNANIGIIAVESHSGGQVWNSNLNSYMEVDEEYDNGSINISPVNIWPNFANGLKNNVNYIYGVECYFMMQQINDEILESGNQHYGKDIIEHPFNVERSKHFIRTLFEFKIKFNRNGNLILNCGRDHNTDIENWINTNEIDEIAQFRANYVRINTIG